MGIRAFVAHPPSPRPPIPIRIHQRHRVLKHRHHPQTEQIHLDEPHVGAVVLVPLDDDAAGHARVLERHDVVEPPLAHHHAAGVLAEMPRQVLDLFPQAAERLDDRLLEVDPDVAQVALERLFRIDELEVIHDLGEPVHLFRLDRQHLAHFTCGAPAAIRDHVGRHRGAELSVLLVHVLDDALAAVAARQIDVDVRPLAALFREEPLEQQVHPDRIDRGDPEAVADGAVGRRAAALHEDVLLPAEVHDVPDDQEVAGEIELLDQIQLALDLPPGAIVVGPIPLARARLRDLPQERRHRLAGRHRVFGKAIAEVRHRVFEAVGELARPRERFRNVGEQPRHGVRRLQIPLRVTRQPPPRTLERGLVTDAGEHVVQRPRGRPRRTARRWSQSPARERRRRDRAAPRYRPLPRAAGAAAARYACSTAPKRPTMRSTRPPTPKRAAQRGAADQRHQPPRVSIELLERQRPFAFRRPQLHLRQQPAQIPIALARFDQHG